MINCLRASNRVGLNEILSMYRIMACSIIDKPYSMASLVSLSPELSNLDLLSSSKPNLKKGWEGGSKANSNFDARLLTPLAPTELYGVS